MKSLKVLMKKAYKESKLDDNVCISRYCEREKGKYKVEIKSTVTDDKMILISLQYEHGELLVYSCMGYITMNEDDEFEFVLKNIYKIEDLIDGYLESNFAEKAVSEFMIEFVGKNEDFAKIEIIR